MQNYFNYFTEIEERFQQRRGSLLMLSTLDWALIETWREAAVPLEAVLRGIDQAFDKYDDRARRSSRQVRKVNGLAWCAQSVMDAAEQAMEAAIGANTETTAVEKTQSGFEVEPVASYLEENARAVGGARLPSPADAIATEIGTRLRELASVMRVGGSDSLEELDRTLSVLEERLFAALMTSADESTLEALREQAAREIAPYRGKMQAVQTRQVQQQFLQKKLLEEYKLPRLSLFYMRLN